MKDKFSIFSDALSKKIVILDGGLGTMIQNYNLKEADFRGERFSDWSCSVQGFNDLLSITKPEVLEEIHTQYLASGADIITTNSFNSNAISMREYEMSQFAYELNLASATIAKKAADSFRKEGKECFVAGSVGPTSHSLTIEPFLDLPEDKMVSYEQLKNSYIEQIEGLIDGGVDIILVETAYDIINVEAAVEAFRTVVDKKQIAIPLMVSVTISEASGATLSGHSPLDIYSAIKDEKYLISMGLNCSFGADLMLPHIKTLAESCKINISSHPNAGLPDSNGIYSQTPEVMVESIKHFFEAGVINIIGGCCGTNPQHIEKISECLALGYSGKKLQ